MKQKQRVPKGEKYWYINEAYNISEWEDMGGVFAQMHFLSGNYFTSREDAEAMAKKLRAVLRGADVIEMPSGGEDLINMLPDADAYDEFANGASLGWRECFKWIKSKIVK